MRTFVNQDEALDFVTHELPWGAAAGTCKDLATAKKYAQAGFPIVSWGSTTTLARAGNAGDNFYYDEETGNSVNAWGIPNKGNAAYLHEMAQAKRAVNAEGSRLLASISAGDKFDPQEYYDMAVDINKHDAADIIEGNKSCGNMKVGDEYKPIVCYDIPAFTSGVTALRQGAGDKQTSIKLTPTTERRFLIKNVEICVDLGIDYIVLANTIPNSYLEKPDGTPGITMVRGGLAGRALRPIVTGMLQMAAPVVKGTKTKLLAAGGVEDGKSAYQYLRHGANGFVFSTLLWRNNFNPKCGQEIIFGTEGPGSRSVSLLDLLVQYGLPD